MQHSQFLVVSQQNIR